MSRTGKIFCWSIGLASVLYIGYLLTGNAAITFYYNDSNTAQAIPFEFYIDEKFQFSLEIEPHEFTVMSEYVCRPGIGDHRIKVVCDNRAVLDTVILTTWNGNFWIGFGRDSLTREVCTVFQE
jgi:hypothetical protein